MPLKLGVRQRKDKVNHLFTEVKADAPATSTPWDDDTSSPTTQTTPVTNEWSAPSTPSISVWVDEKTQGIQAKDDNEGKDTETTALLAPRGSPESSQRSSPERRGDGFATINMMPNRTILRRKAKKATRPSLRSSPPGPRYVPTDWDDSLPYGGKVYLARRKKPDSWLCIAIQVFLVSFACGMIYYAWYYTDHMHFHATKLYGHFGHVHAQALTAEKYLYGKGVERNHSEAMKWYKKAAEQGHPHSAYNLAIGHLQGLDVGLQPGEAHELIKHAAKEGVIEAAEVLNKLCSRGKCDH